jgi:hypothetical protein
VLAQNGFIMHCKIVICTMSFSNNVKKKLMPVKERAGGKSGGGFLSSAGGDILQKHG